MAKAFVVCYQADRPRHPFAHMHLVQNGEDAGYNGRSALARLAGLQLRYVPLWTQPGLLPREESRGDTFTNVGYFGIRDELDPSLAEAAFTDRLHERGFNFTIIDPTRWHDYRDVDVALAVRSFKYPGRFWKKPPSKLFNAWRASVPAIVGEESAYQAERRSDVDFIEVSSRKAVEDALEQLRRDGNLRDRLIANGRCRASEVSDGAITRRWRSVLENDAIPAYRRWRRSSATARRTWIAWRGLTGQLADNVNPIVAARRPSREVLRHRGDWS
jgi:hypothetical protein